MAGVWVEPSRIPERAITFGAHRRGFGVPQPRPPISPNFAGSPINAWSLKYWRFATMFTTSCFLAVVFATVPPSLGSPASLEATSQASVRLRLNVIETAKLLERYATLLQREMDLHDSVMAFVNWR